MSANIWFFLSFEAKIVGLSKINISITSGKTNLISMITINDSLMIPSMYDDGFDDAGWIVGSIVTAGVIGFLLNFAVIAVLVQKRNRYAATDLYLVNLAVGKLILLRSILLR